MPRGSVPTCVSARSSWGRQSHRSEPSTSPVRHSEWRRVVTACEGRGRARLGTSAQRADLIASPPPIGGKEASFQDRPGDLPVAQQDPSKNAAGKNAGKNAAAPAPKTAITPTRAEEDKVFARCNVRHYTKP